MFISWEKKKGVIAVIFLFISLAIVPSIHANIQSETLDSELVEITMEVCGLSGQTPKTIQLTREQAEKVERLFDEIKIKLNNVETRVEKVKIFNEAIVELDKYGLLVGLDVELAKQMVTWRFQNSGNRMCLIVGRTSETTFYGPGLTILSQIILNLPLYYIKDLYKAFLYFYQIFNICRPINFFGFGHTICMGRYLIDDVSGGSRHSPASGWITTFGLNGLQRWNGSMYGNLSLSNFERYYGLSGTIDYPGIAGFIGLKIDLNWLETNWFYLGSALKVEIEEV